MLKPCQTLATKSAERHLRNALNSLLDLYSPAGTGQLLSSQQDSSTCHPKRTPKNCLTSPLESIKNNLLSTVAKHSNSSRIRAHVTQNARRNAEKLPHVTFGIHKKQYFVKNACRSDIISAAVFNQTPRRAPPLARGRRILFRSIDRKLMKGKSR